MIDEITDIKLWGECNEASGSSKLQWSREALNNSEYDVIMNSIKNTNLKQHFFHPSSHQSNFLPIKREVEFLNLDNTMKDILKLVKYKNDVKEIVEKRKQKRDITQLDEQIRVLPLPKLLQENRSVPHQPFFIHHENKFINGMWNEKPLQLTAESALNALSTSTATILAFVGFAETTAVPLQVLTEIAENYIKKMLKLLKYNVEKERLQGESGFCDVVDRTFHEMGIGSLKNLITYYQNDVLKYKNKKLKTVKEDLAICEDTIEKMREELRQMNDQTLILDDDSLVIPELHVTSMVGNDLLSESFETGLQMLHTLENQQLRDDANSTDREIIMRNKLMKNEFGSCKSIKRKRKLT